MCGYLSLFTSGCLNGVYSNLPKYNNHACTLYYNLLISFTLGALFYVVEITSPDEFFQLLPAKGSLSFFLPVIERCCQLYAAEQLGDEIRTSILS